MNYMKKETCRYPVGITCLKRHHKKILKRCFIQSTVNSHQNSLTLLINQSSSFRYKSLVLLGKLSRLKIPNMRVARNKYTHKTYSFENYFLKKSLYILILSSLTNDPNSFKEKEKNTEKITAIFKFCPVVFFCLLNMFMFPCLTFQKYHVLKN